MSTRQAIERGHALIQWYGEIDEADKDSLQDLITEILLALHTSGEDTDAILSMAVMSFEAETGRTPFNLKNSIALLNPPSNEPDSICALI